MIDKNEPIRSEGQGRPFPMHDEIINARNDEERQKRIVIELDDLNGQDGNRGMPKSFVRKAGRVLPSFKKYWTEDGVEEVVDGSMDIQ